MSFPATHQTAPTRMALPIRSPLLRMSASRNGAVRALGKTVRLRDKEHWNFVSSRHCLACGRTPSDFGLSSLARRAAGSVTSSPYHCVASTIVSFTARVTRLPGGVGSPSILYRSRSSYGSTHGSMTRRSRPVDATRLGLQPQRKSPSKVQLARTLIEVWIRAANDLVSTDQGQSTQVPKTKGGKRSSRRSNVAAISPRFRFSRAQRSPRRPSG